NFGSLLKKLDKNSRWGQEYKRWESLKPLDSRGRKEGTRREDARESDLPGLLELASYNFDVNKCLGRLGLTLEGMKTQKRIRAGDWVKYDRKLMARQYEAVFDDYNLPYVTGPSGTTAALLQTAYAFGLSDSHKDEFRQYLLACVAYLVGGGMHSCHEV